MNPFSRPLPAALLCAALITTTALPSHAAVPADMLADYARQSGAPPQAERGRAFFNTLHGRDWSCASCHGAVPTRAGRHAGTGKPITALAPAVSRERFADAARTEKWFRRNCNDVVGRECTTAEKADVLAWLMSLQP